MKHYQAMMDPSCCVCLNSFLTLIELSKKDDRDVSLLEKLQTNVPQIIWTTDFLICEPCANLLSMVHNFRETCVRSEEIRQETLHEVKVKELLIKSDDLDCTNDKAEDIKGDEDEDLNDSGGDDDKYSDEFKTEVEPRKRNRKILRFICDRCSLEFTSSPGLIKHCVSKHGLDPKDVRPYACKRCDSRFANSSNLLQHVKYHDAVRSNICSFCGKGFITKTDLTIHEKQHLNRREYKCATCCKAFNTHKDLRSHNLVVHTAPELWKYVCEFCRKRFPIKSNYDCHLRRHMGDRRFQCHMCEKKFTDKCVLQRHMRTHSNVRDWKCSECGKEYKDKRVMRIHKAKVHEIGVGEIKLPSKERRFQCHICPKSYYAKNKLTRHLYTHSGEKPFECASCDKRFNDKSYLKQHMKKSHDGAGDGSEKGFC